jgi:hypothetical protein
LIRFLFSILAIAVATSHPIVAQESKSASQRQTGPKADIGTGAMNRQVNQRDAKNQKLARDAPVADPALAQYGIYAEDAPNPDRTAPVATTLPSEARPRRPHRLCWEHAARPRAGLRLV